ncbi:MAG: hypothetical protein C5B53_12730 [Candidatus Melainabacteria bacterium]|nr:MAG: hypothetical protein C5B53_12730 [Candidatus Melainabacteria bacterium]
MKRLINITVLGTALAFAVSGFIAGKVNAQNGPMINKKSIEHTTWHTAPREFQIVDDSPIIRDFREAPQNPGQIALPPGPSAGPGGGHGEGALGPLGGGSPSIPAGGMPLPGGSGPGYRSNPSSIPNLGTLPKSGFGGSNIPARGMGPRGLLPNGSTQNVIGKLMASKKPVPVAQSAGPARGMSAPAPRTMGNTAGPAVASYGGGSGTGIGPDYGGSANRTETFVRGSLLRK